MTFPAFARARAISEPPLALAERLLAEPEGPANAVTARRLLEAYDTLAFKARQAFLADLARGFEPEGSRLTAAAQSYLRSPGGQAAADLSTASQGPRNTLFQRLMGASGGLGALIRLREDVLSHGCGRETARILNGELGRLFATAFNRAFLELRQIDWRAPAVLLELLMARESVHPMDGWPDLRRRLRPDRRCYGLFHPALRDDPLIFVEVALTRRLPATIAGILAEAPVGGVAADTAAFYSINSCHKGLTGIPFGHTLIREVVAQLRAELPRVRRFATLSPAPGFRAWVDERLAEPGSDASLSGDLAALGWHADADSARRLRRPLTRLCLEYLRAERSAAGPLDPVARFHLGNGARLGRINWLGNASPRGLSESYGMMVNYIYDTLPSPWGCCGRRLRPSAARR